MMGGPGMQGMVRPGQFALQQFVFLLFYKHLLVFVFVFVAKTKAKSFNHLFVCSYNTPTT